MSTAAKVPRSGRARLDGGAPLPHKFRVPGAGHLPRVQRAEQARDPGTAAHRLPCRQPPAVAAVSPVHEVISEQRLLARNVPTAAAAIPHRGMTGRRLLTAAALAGWLE